MIPPRNQPSRPSAHNAIRNTDAPRWNGNLINSGSVPTARNVPQYGTRLSEKARQQLLAVAGNGTRHGAEAERREHHQPSVVVLFDPVVRDPVGQDGERNLRPTE